MSISGVTFETVAEPKRIGASRIGLIVPSSNTTTETELPEFFHRQSGAPGTIQAPHNRSVTEQFPRHST
jgi:maleate isomerase